MKDKKFFTLILGLVGIYGFSDMKLIFYDILKIALNLSDYQLGTLWGAFGSVALISYIVGGMIADKVHPSILIGASLIASGALHFLMSVIPTLVLEGAISVAGSYRILVSISALMGLCAVMLYFPASSKLLIHWEEQTGRKMMGVYYGVAGFVTALLSLGAVMVYRAFSDEMLIYRFILSAYATINVIAGAMLLIMLKNEKIKLADNKTCHDNIAGRIKSVIRIAFSRSILGIALIIMCNYVSCSLITYINPYLVEKYGFSEENTLLFAVFRFGILCLVSGVLITKLAERKKSAKQAIEVFLLALCVTLLLLIVNEISARSFVVASVLTVTLCLFALGVKSTGLSLVAESKVPTESVGTCIGLISVIGYSPDAWFYPLAGNIVSNSDRYGFLILFAIGLVLAVIALMLIKTGNI